MNGHCIKSQNLTKMPVTFDTLAQIEEKAHFWIAHINTFRMIYILFGFVEVGILPLFLKMTSFVIAELSN